MWKALGSHQQVKIHLVVLELCVQYITYNCTSKTIQSNLDLGNELDQTIVTQKHNQLVLEEQLVEDDHSAAPFVPLSALNPFTDTSPKELLERRYLIHDVAAWTGTDIFLEGGKELIALTPIVQALRTFRLFRGSVKYTVNLTSTPSEYGAVVMSTVPYFRTLLTANNLYSDNSIMSARPKVLSIAAADSGELCNAFVCPMAYIPLNGEITYTAEELKWFEFSNLYIMAPLGIISANNKVAPTIGLQVYANFCDLEIAGVSEAQSFEELGNSSFFNETFECEAQGDRNTPLTLTTAASAIFGMAGTSIYGSMTRAANKRIENTIDGFVNPSDERNQDGEKTTVGQSLWGELSRCNGSLPANTLDSGLSRRKLDQKLFGEKDHTITSIIQTPGLLSKNTLSSGQSYSTEVSVVGLSAGATYVGAMSRCFRLWRGSIKYMFQFFASPLISAKMLISLNFAGAANTNLGDIYTKVVTIRGDTNVEFCVPYLSFYAWAETLPTAHSILNPLSLGGTLEHPTLKVEFLVPPIYPVAGGTPSVGLLVWASAGEDFMFASPQSPFSDITAVFEEEKKEKGKGKRNLKSEAQTDIQAEFSKEFESFCGQSTDAVFMPFDPVMTLEDLLSRYSRRNSNLTSIIFDSTGITSALVDVKHMDTFDYIGNMFLGARGSVVHKIEINSGDGVFSLNGNSTGSTSTAFSVPAGNGAARFNKDVWRMCEFEHPFISVCLFDLIQLASLSFPMPTVTQFGWTATGSFTAGDNYVKGGPDLQLIYLMPPYSSTIVTIT